MYGGYYGFYWDPTYFMVVIGAIICLIASARVKSTFNRFDKVRSYSGLTGAQAAERMLQMSGIYDVKVGHVRGNLTDHYNPKTKTLNLSDSVYNSTSVAAIGVAAHECGHAIQHKIGYFPLKMRAVSVPVANIGSKLSWPIILIGMIIGQMGIARIGVRLFGFVVLFQLITLPVEFDASHRALKILEEKRLLIGGEMKGATKVLKAAALTYVASLFSSILQFLRLLILTQGNGRRRR